MARSIESRLDDIKDSIDEQIGELTDGQRKLDAFDELKNYIDRLISDVQYAIEDRRRARKKV